MKDFERLCAACVLVLALALPAFAGHIPCGVTDARPPLQQQQAAPGEIQNPKDALIDVVLALLAAALP